MSQRSHEGKAISQALDYATPTHRGRRLAVLLPLMLAALYALGYAGMRATGRIRPFYNQGGFEMDSDDRVALLFLPLIEAERAWHDAFSDPPAGA